jgi:hypothetical protein
MTWTGLVIGAAGSVGFLLHKGGGNRTVLAIMMLWVLAPLVLLALAYARSKRWAVPMTFVIMAGALVVYGVDAVVPLRPQAAFPFVLVPLVSLPLIAFVALIAQRASRG